MAMLKMPTILVRFIWICPGTQQTSVCRRAIAHMSHKPTFCDNDRDQNDFCFGPEQRKFMSAPMSAIAVTPDLVCSTRGLSLLTVTGSASKRRRAPSHRLTRDRALEVRCVMAENAETARSTPAFRSNMSLGGLREKVNVNLTYRRLCRLGALGSRR